MIQMRHISIFSVVCASALVALLPAHAQQSPTLSAKELSEDIHTLTFIRQLELSVKQLESLLNLAKRIELERQSADKFDTPEIRAVLAKIRQGLIEEQDKEQLAPLYEQLESLMPDKATAKSKEGALKEVLMTWAKEAVAILQPQQVVRLVGEKGGNSSEQLIGALRKLRGAPPEEREGFLKEFLAATAKRLGRGDAKKTETLRTQLHNFFEKGFKLNEAEFEAQLKSLTEQAEQIVKDALGSPVNALQIQAEEKIAGFLMNPRLVAILQARLDYLQGK
jgi:hypothetical protein